MCVCVCYSSGPSLGFKPAGLPWADHSALGRRQWQNLSISPHPLIMTFCSVSNLSVWDINTLHLYQNKYGVSALPFLNTPDAALN